MGLSKETVAFLRDVYSSNLVFITWKRQIMEPVKIRRGLPVHVTSK